MISPVKVLCVGGSDSGGGAGIQADLKAIDACGCYGMSVITALTAQNTRGVQDIFPVTGKFIAAQLDSVLGDIGADAVKTGMLLTAGAVETVVEKIEQYRLPKVVVDPVMTAKGGRAMMQERARQALIRKLLPLAFAVTPNIPEAESLTGGKIRTVAAMKKAAVAISGMGVKNVVIKGGHLPGSRKSGSIDVLYDGCQCYEFSSDWIDTRDTHGTGCTFASALACSLAQDSEIFQAVQRAKCMVTHAIQHSLRLGKGRGPVHIGRELFSGRRDHECLTALQAAVRALTVVNCGPLIPEVSSNLVYAMRGARDESHVAGFPGRITRLFDRACITSAPEFGASQHMAHVVLTVMKKCPACRAAMNIKYSPEIISAGERIGLSVGSFDRILEPVQNQNKDGFTLEWGVHQVLSQTGGVLDIIYDTGGWGKEPMVRVLGRNPGEVVKKTLAILQELLLSEGGSTSNGT